jgi:Protein of unknown function (DUF2946)
VWRMSKVHHRLRPWLAMVVAYALALQLLLSGAQLQGVNAAEDPLAGQFAICHTGNGTSNDDTGGPATPAGAHHYCVLCVVAGGSLAVLPTDRIAVIRVADHLAVLVPARDDRIACYHSPTGQFQRGPPVHRHLAG